MLLNTQQIPGMDLASWIWFLFVARGALLQHNVKSLLGMSKVLAPADTK